MNDLQAAIAVMRKSPKSSLDVWVWGMTWTQEEHEAFQTVLVAAEKVPGLEMQVFDSESAVGCLQRDVAALEQRLAEAEKTVAIKPDPEVAAAIATVHALLGELSCALVRTDEWAAFNLLINRASGVTVTRLRAEIAAERARADEAEVNAARYEALCGLSCEVTKEDNPAGVVAVLWHVPKFLMKKTNLQLNALADSLLAEGTAPQEGSAI
jgi:hypothetical protein